MQLFVWVGYNILVSNDFILLCLVGSLEFILLVAASTLKYKQIR